MIVIVTGSRYINVHHKVHEILDKIHAKNPITVLIHGDARGLDSIAKCWALGKKITQIPFPANWDAYGLSAGSKRNQEMLDEANADLLIAFAGCNGTNDMVHRTTKQGLKILDLRGVTLDLINNQLKKFEVRELKEAIAHAANGHQAVHLHTICPPTAPLCFKKTISQGKPIAHLFDNDVDRLIRTVKVLGVNVIKVEREGTDKQHIDLCGKPLDKLLKQIPFIK